MADSAVALRRQPEHQIAVTMSNGDRRRPRRARPRIAPSNL